MLSEYLRNRLQRYGFVESEIQITPVAVRITIKATEPGRIVGRKGESIKRLSEEIRRKFNFEKVQIGMIDVEKPFLEPNVVARRIVSGIERGGRIRSLLHRNLRRIMQAGARGAEIVASGKLGQKGAKARTIKVRAGYVPKAGEPARQVKIAKATAYPKPGAIGIVVRIAPPDLKMPGEENESA